MRPALMLVVGLTLTACSDCGSQKGGAPSEHTWRQVTDPYAGLGARGSTPDAERAALVLEHVAKDLGYSGVGDEFRARKGEPFVLRETFLLAHGGNDQVEAAWIDAEGFIVQALGSSQDLRVHMRQSEARVQDARNTGAAPDVLRRVELAELAWIFHLLSRLRIDAGLPAPAGWDGK